MTVPWQIVKVTISGNWFRCPDFVSTRLSPLEAQTPLLLPPSPITNFQQQLKVSSLNVSVLTWKLVKMIGGFVPLSNLFSPDAEVMVSHVTGDGSTQ